MDLAVSAVHEDGFRGVHADQLVLKEFEITILGEAVEILMHGCPFAKQTGQPAPGTAVAQEIPEGVEMADNICGFSACMHKVVVSAPEFFDLIFLAAHGADPA